MKVLYVGPERRKAELAASALRGIARNVAVSWTPRLDQAARWIDHNRDLAALIVEAHVDAGHAPSRPIIVVTPKGSGLHFEWLEGAESLANSQSIEPAAVSGGQAQFQALVGLERAARAGLELDLAHARAILQEAQERYRAALAAAQEQAARRQAEFEIGMARAAATREMVDEQLREAAIQLDQSRRDQASAAEAHADRLARRESELEAQIAQEAERSRDLDTSLGRAQQTLDSQAAEIERLNEREADLSSRLANVHGERDALEHQLGDLAAAMAAAADREKELGNQIHEERAARAGLARRLTDAAAALEDGRRDYETLATAIERLTEHNADLSSQLANVHSERETLAHQLAGAASAIADAADREKALGAELQDERAAHASVSQRLTEAEAALERTGRDLQAAVADASRLTEREADLASQLANVQSERNALAHQLTDAGLAIAAAADRENALGAQLERERAGAAGREANLEARLAQAVATIDALERTLTETRSAALDAERSFKEEIETILAREFAESLRFESRIADQQTEHAAALAARNHEIEQVRGEIGETRQVLSLAQREKAALQIEADRVPQLLRQLDESRAESERLFQQAPLAMFRCTRDGALIQANPAWSALVHRTIDDIRGEDFAATIFESPRDLSWLIDRCLTSRAKESIETTVLREDGARLFVRMWARATANMIEIAAEDLTSRRVLQDRLAQAGRMEAVGRVASEVALTCSRLLGEVRQNAQQWLAGAGATGTSRRGGETLLADLTRAAAILEQLAAFGDKQTRMPALTDLHTVVRNLAPVLKHVAGDTVDVRLPDKTSSMTVDVETERVERLLVNLAAYGRERMPSGGRLTIEVGTSIVDRKFTARYPNVRPGPHALITVTEARRPAGADGLLQLRDGTANALSSRAAGTVGHKAGVDLGTLQGLVGECGGHLWMKVQPLGDIVAKIRLPLLRPYDEAPEDALAARGGRRTIARWFHH